MHQLPSWQCNLFTSEVSPQTIQISPAVPETKVYLGIYVSGCSDLLQLCTEMLDHPRRERGDPYLIKKIVCRGYDHTRKSAWRCYNVGGLSEHVTCHMFRFLSIPFFFLFTGCHLEKSKNCHISATVLPIINKFGMVAHVDFRHADRLNFDILKIQHDGGRQC